MIKIIKRLYILFLIFILWIPTLILIFVLSSEYERIDSRIFGMERTDEIIIMFDDHVDIEIGNLPWRVTYEVLESLIVYTIVFTILFFFIDRLIHFLKSLFIKIINYIDQDDNPTSIWIQRVTLLTFLLMLFNCQTIYYNLTLDYCDCKEYSRDAVKYYSLGPDYGSYSSSAIESCANRIIDQLDLDISSDKMSIDYISQVSYEVCEYGSYKSRNGKTIRE